MIIPKLFEAPIADNSPLKSELRLLPADDAVVDSSCTDAANTPTYWFRAGGVLAYKTSTGTFVSADDATGDRDAAATVSSSIGIGAGAANKTFIWTYKGGPSQTVTGVTATTTATAWASLLNTNAGFSADLIATVVTTTTLVITAREAGGLEYFTLGAGTLNNQGGGAGNDTFTGAASYSGTYADYRVTLADCVLQDKNGVAVSATARACAAGHFSKARLRNLTGQAAACLMRRLSILDA